MLSYMRRNAGSWIIKVLFVLIALTFIGGFGILPQIRRWEERKDLVARVGDRSITRTQVDQAYQRLLQTYQQIYKDKISEEMLKQLRLKETALNGLINNALQVEEARKLGIELTDEELQSWIQSFPYFQKDGRFSKEQYLRILRLNNIEPGIFESQQREELLIGKIGQLVRDSVKLSDQELWDIYRLDKERVRLRCLVFDPRKYEHLVKPSEQQLREYFEAHREAYKSPERRKAVCAVFKPEDYRGEVQVLTGDIEEYYDLHMEEYSHPEEMKLRQIVLEVGPHEEKAAFEQKRKKLEGILERIHKGEDFARLAKEYSQDAAAKDGGNLGFVKKSELAPEIANAAFSLKPGEVSSIVVSPKGLHILKAEEYRSPKVDPLETVKASIERALREEKSRLLARRKAEEFLWNLREKGGASALVPGLDTGAGSVVVETGSFARGESVPGIGADEAFKQAAFSMEPGVLSEVVKGNRAFYVLKVTERKEPAVPPFEDVASEVRKDLVKQESIALAKRRAEEVLEEARKGKDIFALAKTEGIESLETDWFNRMAPFIPGLGSSEELKEAAFSLTAANPLPKKPIEIAGKFYVVAFKDHAEPRREEFEANKEALRQEEERKKQEEAYRSWLAGLRAGVEIKIAPAEL